MVLCLRRRRHHLNLIISALPLNRIIHPLFLFHHRPPLHCHKYTQVRPQDVPICLNLLSATITNSSQFINQSPRPLLTLLLMYSPRHPRHPHNQQGTSLIILTLHNRNGCHLMATQTIRHCRARVGRHRVADHRTWLITFLPSSFFCDTSII